jgi:uncharacterized membrane protein YbaN (DUF454 family)
MQTTLFISSAAFCYLHSYRDWLHSKKIFNSWFTRFGHIWDAPQYEKHGMVAYFLLGNLFVYLAIR